MFRKILVANRGEIACRIMRTARRLGIATVAVYSEADRNALPAETADEAVAIGPAQAAASYLSIVNIVEACRATGAEAVHPGYGFLSENADFARAVEAAGIVFIGPPPEAIEAMGDKIRSKRIAAEAGVRVVPGHTDIVTDADHAARVAAEVGYPVMLKASAGGGGKGMRVARDEATLLEEFSSARSEARSAFGDERVFIEKYIEEPRHIEIQVLADAHGNVIHLGERECSIQRRNQKVIEEAPSCFLDEATRAEMGAQAIALARAVGYRSAGTVEFIVDRDRNFYFLEMNTRLQVEHPVTELVTGLDLVEEMIRIAAGEPLRLRQQDVRTNGWAIEARIYAEDPFREFLPSTGRLTRYAPPSDSQLDATIRIDSGVAEGSEIPVFYDPLVAKLCTHAATRDAATKAMGEALDAFELEGIRHNIPFLSALMAHPRWREGRLSTALIAEEFPEGFHGRVQDEKERDLLAAVAVAVELAKPRRAASRTTREATFDGVLEFGSEALPIQADAILFKPLVAEVAIGGRKALRVESDWRPGERIFRGSVGGEGVIAHLRRRGHRLEISRRGATIVARLLSRRAAELAALMPAHAGADSTRALRCPMPGLVVSIAVAEGQRVEAGETLAVVEAMKMENVLRAERADVVRRIVARPGDILAVDDVIIEFA